MSASTTCCTPGTSVYQVMTGERVRSADERGRNLTLETRASDYIHENKSDYISKIFMAKIIVRGSYT